MRELPTADYMSLRFWSQRGDKYEQVLPNTFTGSRGEYEMDLMCIRKSGYVEEVEIKRSVADFRNDFKKTARDKLIGPSRYAYNMDRGRLYEYRDRNKHEMLAAGLLLANRFSFLIPEEIQDKCEIPEYAGLYVLTADSRIHQVKTANELHKNKIDEKLLLQIGRKMMFRYWALKAKNKSN